MSFESRIYVSLLLRFAFRKMQYLTVVLMKIKILLDMDIDIQSDVK